MLSITVQIWSLVWGGVTGPSAPTPILRIPWLPGGNRVYSYWITLIHYQHSFYRGDAEVFSLEVCLLALTVP